MQTTNARPSLQKLFLQFLRTSGASQNYTNCCSSADCSESTKQQLNACENDAAEGLGSFSAPDSISGQHTELKPIKATTSFEVGHGLVNGIMRRKGLSLVLPNADKCPNPHYPVRTYASEAPSKYVVGNGPMTMKGVILPSPNEKMYVEEFQIPKPKIGEVLIKTKACGVCHTDLHVIKGEQKFPTPGVLGHEVSGTVLDHGPGTDPATVRRLPVGARVVGAFIMPCGGCFFCTRGQEEICSTFFEYNRGKGTLYDGQTRLFTAKDGTPISMYSMAGLAEYCVMPASALAVLPETLPFAESAIMGCAIFTAYGALRNGADLRAGETVAVVGVGGVGGGIVQLAKAFGAKTVIAVDISDEKLRSAKRLGATHVVNGAREDVSEKVREYTAGRGVDAAFEALGKSVTFGQALAAIRPGGRAVMVGIAPTGTMAEVEITRIVRNEIRIIGSYGARTRHDLPDVIDLAAMGKFDVAAPVSRSYALEEAGEAYAALDRGEIDGRAIVLMDE